MKFQFTNILQRRSNNENNGCPKVKNGTVCEISVKSYDISVLECEGGITNCKSSQGQKGKH